MVGIGSFRIETEATWPLSPGTIHVRMLGGVEGTRDDAVTANPTTGNKIPPRAIP
jgi:hypothetical protein